MHYIVLLRLHLIQMPEPNIRAPSILIRHIYKDAPQMFYRRTFRIIGLE